jgi:hypothetical protein
MFRVLFWFVSLLSQVILPANGCAADKLVGITDRKILEASYSTEMKALEPRLELKTDAVDAIIAEAEATDPRAKKFKAAQFIDRRYLEEMEKSGFFDSLWGRKAK